jgi:hypothetical protein
LPMAMFQYKISRYKNIHFFYRTSTNTPSISQLQNVVDNSNTLLLTTGNPHLSQEYSHNFMLRYGTTNTNRSTNFFMFLNASFIQNHINNATIIPDKDTIIDNIILKRGTQLSIPVNTDGYSTLNAFSAFGFPVNPLKSNINLNAGLSYIHSPGMINNLKNISETITPNIGIVIASNISDKTDFTLSYTGNYNFVSNSLSLNKNENNNYFSQTATAKFYQLLLKRFVITSDFSYTKYDGLSGSYNQEIFLWNAGIAYKFLKNNAAEIKFSVTDILNQNKSISRTVYETYIEDNQTQTLKRYFILTFTYNLRSFNNKYNI